jgi:hypothetical protein
VRLPRLRTAHGTAQLHAGRIGGNPPARG